MSAEKSVGFSVKHTAGVCTCVLIYTNVVTLICKNIKNSCSQKQHLHIQVCMDHGLCGLIGCYSQLLTEEGLARCASADKKLSALTCCPHCGHFTKNCSKRQKYHEPTRKLRPVFNSNLHNLCVFLVSICIYLSKINVWCCNVIYMTLHFYRIHIIFQKHRCTTTQMLWVLAQVSLSLIKYWTRAEGRNSEAEKKRASGIIKCWRHFSGRTSSAPPVAPLCEAFNQ